MASSMLAARDIMVGEFRKLDNLAEAAAGGDREALAKFRYQLELVANIQRQYKGSQTEIARTLGSMKVPARGSDDNPLVAANAKKL